MSRNRRFTRSYFEQILGSLAIRKPKPHTPRFRIAREGDNWRIFDGEKPIALFMPTAMDIWSFSPFQPDEMANREPPGKLLDIHTVHNTLINIGTQGWPKHWNEQGGPRRVKWKWLKRSGRELLARITTDFADGEGAAWLLRVRYDPAWGRYRYTCDITARKRHPKGFEPFNLMAPGAVADRVKDRRWTHSIWEKPAGELRRIVHSTALLCCTDFGYGCEQTREDHQSWLIRNAPFPRAWVAYAAHRSFNPAILIHHSNVPMRQATCDALFDEHIKWADAGQDNLTEDGYFEFEMRVEIVNLPAALAKLLRAAKDPIKPTHWRRRDIALPFYVDRVNSFERELDPWRPHECAVIAIPRDGAGGIAWDHRVAHSGRRSIRLSADGIAQRREIFPIGAVCRVRRDSRYRLSGWIKTAKVTRFARLELAAYEYTYANVTASAESQGVTGSRGWTRVAVDFDTTDAAYVMPKLVLYGPGTAWFDDVRFELL